MPSARRTPCAASSARGPPTPASSPHRDKREAAGETVIARTVYRAAGLPFRLIGTVLKRAAQVVFSIVFLVLHPQLKWLLLRLWHSPPMRDYVRPALQEAVLRISRPYLAFLRGLPPFLATLSIAVPLAVLEPAKLYATVLLVTHPRTGAALLLFLHALSFVLIDATWTAVRPQSRRLRLVARLHALIWLNVAYGKYWLTHSSAYRAIRQWMARTRRAMWALLAKLRQALRT